MENHPKYYTKKKICKLKENLKKGKKPAHKNFSHKITTTGKYKYAFMKGQ